MYGYVTPKKDVMDGKDFLLYRSYYCGICKVTGECYGQLPRFSTNYDMTFLNALLHDIAKTELDFENKGCVLNMVKKKISVKSNSMMDRVVSANIILSYHKALDGLVDKEGVKMRVAKGMLSKAYKKAVAITPEIDEITKKWYGSLRKLELENCASLDRVSDCFASLLRDVVDSLLLHGEVIDREKDIETINSHGRCIVCEMIGKNISEQDLEKYGITKVDDTASQDTTSNENIDADCCLAERSQEDEDKGEAEEVFIKKEITDEEDRVYYESILSLAYNIGKFVYIADALDDIEEDYKKKHYNPFLANDNNFSKREDYFSSHKEEISFLLNSTVNRVIQFFNNISYRMSYSRGLCTNIIYYGLRAKCDELVTASKKLPKPRI